MSIKKMKKKKKSQNAVAPNNLLGIPPEIQELFRGENAPIDPELLDDMPKEKLFKILLEKKTHEFSSPLPPPEYVKAYQELGVWDNTYNDIMLPLVKKKMEVMDSQIRLGDSIANVSEGFLKQKGRFEFAQIIMSVIGFICSYFLILLLVVSTIFFAYVEKNGWAISLGIVSLISVLPKFITIPSVQKSSSRKK